MAKRFFLQRGGQNFGPYTVAELLALGQQGAVYQSDWVIAEHDHSNAKPASQVQGLASVPEPVAFEPPAGAWQAPAMDESVALHGCAAASELGARTETICKAQGRPFGVGIRIWVRCLVAGDSSVVHANQESRHPRLELRHRYQMVVDFYTWPGVRNSRGEGDLPGPPW